MGPATAASHASAGTELMLPFVKLGLAQRPAVNPHPLKTPWSPPVAEMGKASDALLEIRTTTLTNNTDQIDFRLQYVSVLGPAMRL